MPRLMRSSATLPFTESVRIFSAAATAASAVAARTSATACASACAIFVSAILVRRSTKSCMRLCDSAALRLVLGEELLGFFLQPARFVEFGLNALAARVERPREHLGHADIDENADEDQEADSDPEFGLCEKFHVRLLALERFVDGGRNCRRRRRRAGEPLDNGACRVHRN